VRQRSRSPEARIAGGNYHGHILGDQRGRRMTAVVGAQLEHLVGHRAHLQGDVQILGQPHQDRVLGDCVAVTDPLGAQDDGVQQILVHVRPVPVGLAGVEVEVDVLGQLEELLGELAQRMALVLLTHQVEANHEVGKLFLELDFFGLKVSAEILIVQNTTYLFQSCVLII